MEPEQPDKRGKKQSKRFLVIYIIGLFSVALVLILLSYLTQVRANKQLESYKNQVSEQTSVAQGAQQQMAALQSTLEEMQKTLNRQNEAIQTIRKGLDVASDKKVEDAVQLLEDKYIALDSLQQVRRASESGDDTRAKSLLQKMIEAFGVKRLLPQGGEDAALLGLNAAEFQQYCEKYEIEINQP